MKKRQKVARPPGSNIRTLIGLLTIATVLLVCWAAVSAVGFVYQATAGFGLAQGTFLVIDMDAPLTASRFWVGLNVIVGVLFALACVAFVGMIAYHFIRGLSSLSLEIGTAVLAKRVGKKTGTTC